MRACLHCSRPPWPTRLCMLLPLLLQPTRRSRCPSRHRRYKSLCRPYTLSAWLSCAWWGCVTGAGCWHAGTNSQARELNLAVDLVGQLKQVASLRLFEPTYFAAPAATSLQPSSSACGVQLDMPAGEASRQRGLLPGGDSSNSEEAAAGGGDVEASQPLLLPADGAGRLPPGLRQRQGHSGASR